MRGIRPIPKQLLIHNVEYEEYTDGDGWDDGYQQPVTIKRVRVEPATELNRTNNREEVTAKHILYIDRVFSTPFVKMKEKSKVTFQGDKYEVHKVNPHYTLGPNPHHYEVELV